TGAPADRAAPAAHPPAHAEATLPAGVPAAWPVRSLVAGGAALALAVVAGCVHPAAFFRAYLPAYLFVLGISLGSLTLAMVGYLTGGGWGRILAPVFRSATSLLPALAVLFLPLLLPVLLRNDWLFPWADPAAQDSEVLRAKAWYLNLAFFLIRAAVYFAVWL